jgi:acetyl esterase/lipase
MRKVLLWVVALIVAIAIGGYAASRFSPWPAAIVIRIPFDLDAWRMDTLLARHVPAGVSARYDVPYLADEPDARLDIYYPSAIENTERTLPTVVWIHGGAFIAGSKSLVSNYLKIIAAAGYTVVGVGYSIAPGASYPTPVRQANAALAYLKENGDAVHVDASRMVLAGDSAGAQIAAQLANIISVPAYASEVGLEPAIERSRLQGVVLFCGVFDLVDANSAGSFTAFVEAVLWAYSGTRDYLTDPAFQKASVAQYVTGAFPPAFISVGNGDPLESQSREFARILEDRGVSVDALFFAEGYDPPVRHVYQFSLDTEAGKLALDRSTAFLDAVMPRD